MKKSFQFYRECQAEPAENEIYGLVLTNGMQVVLMKRLTTPVVAIDIWYKVGSKDEEPGKSGFAHLFEHMMFEGSENVDKAQHMKLINDILENHLDKPIAKQILTDIFNKGRNDDYRVFESYEIDSGADLL